MTIWYDRWWVLNRAGMNLVDLINTSEWAAGQLLERDHVEHGRHAPLTAALLIRRQLRELLRIAKLHSDPHAVLLVVLLYQKQFTYLRQLKHKIRRCKMVTIIPHCKYKLVVGQSQSNWKHSFALVICSKDWHGSGTGGITAVSTVLPREWV